MRDAYIHIYLSLWLCVCGVECAYKDNEGRRNKRTTTTTTTQKRNGEIEFCGNIFRLVLFASYLFRLIRFK